MFLDDYEEVQLEALTYLTGLLLSVFVHHETSLHCLLDKRLNMFRSHFHFYLSSGECNYGGRVTDDKDRRLLMSLLSIFYSRDLIEKDHYELCEGGLYYVPVHSPYQVVPAFDASQRTIPALGRHVYTENVSLSHYCSFDFRNMLNTSGSFRYAPIHACLDFTATPTSRRTIRRPISS